MSQQSPIKDLWIVQSLWDIVSFTHNLLKTLKQKNRQEARAEATAMEEEMEIASEQIKTRETQEVEAREKIAKKWVCFGLQ